MSSRNGPGYKTIFPLHEGDTNDYSHRPYTKIVGLKIDEGVTAIKACFANNELTELVFPNSVTAIFAGTFKKNLLTNIKLSGGLNRIGRGAFMDNYLESIVIPDSVAIIGTDAFKSNRLASVTFGEGLEGIGMDAFRNNKLQSIVLPGSLRWLGDGAFKGNPITSITIGESVEGRDEDGTPSSIPFWTAFGKYGIEFINCYVYNNSAAGTYVYDKKVKEWNYNC
jgi:hypothetical protein